MSKKQQQQGDVTGGTDKIRQNKFLKFFKNLKSKGETKIEVDSRKNVERENVEILPERGNWTGKYDFLLSMIGYSVGLGNVWRFPYLCYSNGGGAFLIPFIIMMIIVGIPLMYMECSFGQYAALGPIAIFPRFCPLFQTFGYAMVLVSALVSLYYNLIIGWTLFYMFASMRSELPWHKCDPEWSTEHCIEYGEANRFETQNETFELKPPAADYFNNYVLGISSGVEETGNIKWTLVMCLFGAWFLVFLCLCKGVKSSGKVVYFTALFPYVVLTILFVRGVTLPGASKGILYFLTPDFKYLTSAKVYGDAAVQVFFALNPSWGGLITLSSYNKFTHNNLKDTVIVVLTNTATSIYAGVVIFSVIGYLAHQLEVDVDKVVDQGAGLAFVVYPEVVTLLPISPLWSVLFFFMLLTLGLDSQFTLVESVITGIQDRFPNTRPKKTWVVLFVSVIGFLLGLVFTTNSGMYWLQLMDTYAANYSLFIMAVVECILIAWLYGSERFLNDIESMVGKQSRFRRVFWSIMWKYVTPLILLFVLIFNWVQYKPATYGDYKYPVWANTIGLVIAFLPVIVIILTVIPQAFKGPKELTFKEQIKFLLKETKEWGPATNASEAAPGPSKA